jgi:hypothetical protein
MSRVLAPRLSLGVDLSPLVINLRVAAHGAKTSERLPYFAHGAGAKITDDDHGAVNERETVVVQEVSVTGEEDAPAFESECRVVFIGVASHPCILGGQYVVTVGADDVCRQRRKIFVGIKPGLGIAAAKFDELVDFLLRRARAALGEIRRRERSGERSGDSIPITDNSAMVAPS